MVSNMNQLLTISQLARYVGVTVRAVRHYHALGLLPEPARDASGYRRYGAEAVIALTRIKTLAAAGVPLRQIETLLAAPPADFQAAITSIQADITQQMAQLEDTKRRLDALQSGDRLFVSEAVADYLTYLRKLGLSDATVAYERGAWILISALYPQQADVWAAEKQAMIARPDIAALYRQLDQARTWPKHDPRLVKLAKKIVRLSARRAAAPLAGYDALAADTRGQALINQHGLEASPSLQQLRDTLAELAKNK
jgi:DNA-binding transcriptional MerR regulator